MGIQAIQLEAVLAPGAASGAHEAPDVAGSRRRVPRSGLRMVLKVPQYGNTATVSAGSSWHSTSSANEYEFCNFCWTLLDAWRAHLVHVQVPQVQALGVAAQDAVQNVPALLAQLAAVVGYCSLAQDLSQTKLEMPAETLCVWALSTCWQHPVGGVQKWSSVEMAYEGVHDWKLRPIGSKGCQHVLNGTGEEPRPAHYILSLSCKLDVRLRGLSRRSANALHSWAHRGRLLDFSKLNLLSS